MQKRMPIASSCYDGVVRATNNMYPNCPPLMSDSRAFTDHRPKGVQALQDIVPLNKGSYELRQHMEKHGQGVVGDLRRAAYAANTCGPCVSPYATGTLVPEMSRESCGPNSCMFVQEHPEGLGMGRNFGENIDTADSYALFITEKRREQEELTKPPCNLAYDPFQDFPIKYTGDGAGRPANPDGR